MVHEISQNTQSLYVSNVLTGFWNQDFLGNDTSFE